MPQTRCPGAPAEWHEQRACHAGFRGNLVGERGCCASLCRIRCRGAGRVARDPLPQVAFDVLHKLAGNFVKRGLRASRSDLVEKVATVIRAR